MKLDKNAVAALALPDGKSDAIFFDEGLPGFGVPIREGGKKVWIIQYRVGHKQRRESLGDVRKVKADAARKEAERRFAGVLLGSDPAAAKAAANVKNKRTRGAAVGQYLTFKADT